MFYKVVFTLLITAGVSLAQARVFPVDSLRLTGDADGHTNNFTNLASVALSPAGPDIAGNTNVWTVTNNSGMIQLLLNSVSVNPFRESLWCVSNGFYRLKTDLIDFGDHWGRSSTNWTVVAPSTNLVADVLWTLSNSVLTMVY